MNAPHIDHLRSMGIDELHLLAGGQSGRPAVAGWDCYHRPHSSFAVLPVVRSTGALLALIPDVTLWATLEGGRCFPCDSRAVAQADMSGLTPAWRPYAFISTIISR